MSIGSIILATGLILLAALAVSKFSSEMGVPSLVVFLAMGFSLGPSGFDLIRVDDPYYAQLIGFFALVVILFEGGLRTRAGDLRKVFLPSLSLATVGVVVTAVVTGFLCVFFLNISLQLGLLIGAIVGSTDAAAVFSVLGNFRIPRPLKQILEAESGMNDPVAIFMTVVLLEYNLSPETFSWIDSLQYLSLQVTVGLLVGIVAGWIIRRGLRLVRLTGSGLYPLLLMACFLTTFGLTSVAGGSGFIAVYLMGIMITDRDLPYRNSVIVFQEGFAWMMQVVLFTMLGTLVVPAQLARVAIPGCLIAFSLIFITRPVAVFLSTIGMGLNVREKVLISWGGLRGAVPIILATYPLVGGLSGSELIFNIVFFVVVVSALLNGWSILHVAGWLGQLLPGERPRSMVLEFLSFKEVDTDMMEIQLPSNATIEGKTVRQLNLPRESVICAVIRDDRVIIPRGHTAFESGDTIFVMSKHSKVEQVEKIFGLADGR